MRLNNLIVFSLLFLLLPNRMFSQWDTLTYPDGHMVKIHLSAGSSDQLPHFFLSGRLFFDASAINIFPRVGEIEAFAGRFIPEKDARKEIGGMLFVYNHRSSWSSSIGVDQANSNYYSVNVSGLVQTMHFGLHGTTGIRKPSPNYSISVSKNGNSYGISQVAVRETAMGVGMIWIKGLVCAVLNPQSTLDDASVRDYRYKIFMVKATADMLYYSGIKFYTTSSIQASDINYDKYGWRVAGTVYWWVEGRTISGHNYFGYSVELAFQHVLYPDFDHRHVGFYATVGIYYAYKASFRNKNVRYYYTPETGKKRRRL